MAGFDTKEMMNRAIRYMAQAAMERAAGGWVPPKERERQQKEAMRQEQQQARQAEKQQKDMMRQEQQQARQAEREQQAQQKQFITDEKERQKNLEAFQKGNHPDVPHVVYHGTGSEHDGDFRVPSFFTSDPQGAEWYAKNRGDNPQIFPVHLSMKKPLDTRSKEGIFKLINIAHNAGVHVELKETPKGWQFTSNDIAKHSPYEGDNPLDLLYIPKVRNALYQNGHDGVIASDVLSNDEIPTFIPLHSQQIKSATGNQGTFNPSASDITKSEGGQILSKQFPTQYMPNVGRQVMADGGDVGGDTATFKGRKFWSGIFDSYDGAIREVHPYHRAKAVDFHHSHYVSPHLQDAMRQGDAGFFWVDKGGKVNTLWRDDEAPKHIVDAIHGQINVIGKARGGEIGRQVMQDGGVPDQPQRQLSPMGFYSAAAERASALQPSGDAVQMVNSLKNLHGVKTEELRNAGLIDESNNVHPDWAGRGKVTRDELVSHLQGQMPQVEETVLGGETPRIKELKNQMSQMAENDPRYFNLEQELLFEQTNSGTKYKNYTLPGGENYREVLLRLPDKRPEVFMVNADSLSKEFSSLQEAENYKKAIMDSYPNAPAPNIKKIKTLDPQKDGFRSQHWNDPNVLAHIRMSDRIVPPSPDKIIDIESRLARVTNAPPNTWGAGLADLAVKKGAISPEEAATYARQKGWRGSEYFDKEGLEQKILHVEELQSDWGQKGKKEGFASSAPVSKFKIGDMAGFNAEYNDFFNKWLLSSDNQSLGVIKQNKKGKYTPEVILRQGVGHDLGEFNTPEEALDAVKNLEVHGHKQTHSLNEIPVDAEKLTAMYLSKDEAEKAAIKHGIPSAPYVTSTEGWTDLALKRVLKEAAEGGYHKVVWTPGEEQAERYDLKNHVSQIFYRPDKEYLTYADIDGGWIDHPDPVTPEKLPEVIGKDAAERLLSQTPDSNDGSYRLRGEDLSFGGEGMKGYYDNIVPKRLQAIAKKHDKNAKVGYTDIMLPAARRKGSNNPPIQAPGIDITPEMRESILRGQSAYADGGEVEREGFAGGGSPDDDMIRDALSRVASPFSDNPELAAKAVEIANQAYKVPTGNITAGPSYYGFKGPMDVSDIQTTVEPLPDVSPAEKNPLSWEDFYNIGKGGTMINLGGDRSRLGRLTHINGKKLAWPVDLHAGPEYMLEPNPGAVWANAPGHTSGLRKKILQAAESGPVYGVYTPMGPKTVDSSYQMFDALLSQIAADPPSKKVAKQLDDSLRQAKFIMGSTDKAIKDREKEKERMQDWPGILNALEAREHAKTLPGSTRSLIVKYLDRAAWHKLGLPHVGITRAAITNPDLLGAPANMMGHRIVELSPEEIEETAFKHNTYKSPTGGKYVGDVPLVQRQYAMPDVMDQFLSRRVGSKGDVIMHPYSLQSGGRDAARKMLEEQKQMQPVSQRMLDSIQQGLERQVKYGLKSGGKVKKHPALSIAGTHIREETHGEPIFTGRL